MRQGVASRYFKRTLEARRHLKSRRPAGFSLPKWGEVGGEWDLRGREKEYLGNVALVGKTVLEIGTASGHLCFWMEKQGANVSAYDLSENQNWDIVPYSTMDFSDHVQRRKAHMRRINNSW